MSVPVGGKIRLAVVGLGPTWKGRYRPALANAADRFRVAGLFDQTPRRSEIEAIALRTRAAGSLRALIGRPDVDAVALLDPQWFGLHALELAARASKPALVAVPLPTDPAELDRIDTVIQGEGASGSILLVGPLAPVAALLAFERLVRGQGSDPAAPTWADMMTEVRASSAEPSGVGLP